jgi:hypothetical protein
MPPSSDSVTTPLAPAPAVARAWLGALLAALREGFAGARQALDRMNKLIYEAHLDYPDR